MSLIDYNVGWICALPIEEAAALDMLDEQHPGSIQQSNCDQNNYILGRIGVHNVVIACLPRGVKGLTSATVVAIQMRFTFPSLRFGLLVGVGGGVPSKRHDIRLGDIVVSSPTGRESGVIQYDFGKTLHEGGFVRTGSLNRPPDVLLNAVSSLEARHANHRSQITSILRDIALRNSSREQACAYLGHDKDYLFERSYVHEDSDDLSCDACDSRYIITRHVRKENGPVIHHGLIASGNQVIRDATMRDRLSGELDVLCFEMEAAGLMDNFPCLVIRGICDYSDSHKNKRWQVYAAEVAAAYAKELLLTVAAAPTFEMDDTDMERYQGAASGRDRSQPPASHPTVFPARRYNSLGAIQADCLRSLWFTEMDSRRENISRAADRTCSWLMQHQKYQTWTSQKDGLLWITGSPGAGKSVLMDNIVREVERQTNSDLIVASFFVHGRGSKMQRSSLGLYRSILHQILTKAKPLLSDLSPVFYSRQQNQGEYGSAWTWQEKEILEFLDKEVKTYTSKRPIRIFIDALDELGETAARKVSLELWHLTSRTPDSGSALSVCLACRHYPIMDMFDSPEICVEDQNSNDISNYVQTTLARVFTDSSSRQTIETEILRKAGGNFLWTALILPKITHLGRSGYRLHTIREAIQRSSPELGQVYKEALVKIPVSEKAVALRLFRWVCLAEEPLSPVAMRDALCFSAEAPQNRKRFSAWTASENYVETEDQIVKQIRALSGGLIEVAGEYLTIVQCIHQSVKDYFLESGLQDLEESIGRHDLRHGVEAALLRAHELIFKGCIHYILTDEILDLSKGETQQPVTRRRYPLLRYAVTKWPFHLKKGDFDGTLQHSTLTYFEWPSHHQLRHWLSLCSDYHGACSLGPSAEILHVAAYYDLYHLVDAVVQSTASPIDPKDSSEYTPLIWATINGHDTVTKRLIHHGANDGRTPLSWAAANSHLASAQALLSRGAKPNIRDNRGWTPLHHAFSVERHKKVFGGSWVVVKLLIRYGAQPNKELSEDQMLLEFAMRCQSLELLQLILQLDVFAKDDHRRALAFLQALLYGNTAAALKIAECGINARKFTDFSGKTPIDYVLTYQCPELAQVLLQPKNCDPNGRSSQGISPLIATSIEGRTEMMEQLLKLGAHVDFSDFDGRTPVSYAAKDGSLSAIKLLIGHGAKLDLKDKTGRTPLSWAAEMGHDAVMGLLLQNGADPKSEDSSRRTPLFWAAKGGKRSAIERLLKERIDTEHRDSKGQTALWWAVRHRKLSTATDLLKAGAEPNTGRLDGQKPLLWAASVGYLLEATLLLEHGAKVDIRNYRQQTPLLLAADNGHVGLVKLLLEHNADPTLHCSENLTPLSAAVKRRFRDVVQILNEWSQPGSSNENTGGPTPLLSAVMTGDDEFAELLLSHNANADYKGYQGRTPLSFACEYGYDRLVKLLLRHAIDVNARDLNGRTPLWWAAASGRPACLEVLLEQGADTNIPCNSGHLPITKAVSNGNTMAACLLLKRRATPSVDQGSNVKLLEIATDNGDVAMVLALVKEGADCEAELPSGYTLSSWAAKNGHLDLVKEFASRGADLWSRKDQYDLTPMDWALKRNRRSVFEFLLETSTLSTTLS